MCAAPGSRSSERPVGTRLPADLAKFVARWSGSGGAERANAQQFLSEFCDVLGVPRPDPATGDPRSDRYVFERDVRIQRPGGVTSVGRIDLYKDGCFILEAKQGSGQGNRATKKGVAARGTPAWHMAMSAAQGQATGYAAALDEPPPFLITCDVGYCFELFASFDGSRHYRAFPNAQKSRIYLTDLAGNDNAEILRQVWTAPRLLDPSLKATKTTTDAATELAEIARALEATGHNPEVVASFLMRCVFTMFAEDVGLLRQNLFSDALKQHWIPDPKGFPRGVEGLWRAMNDGAEFGFVGKLLRFNGGLFARAKALPLTRAQLERLHHVATFDWSEVEPAIFGTLLERALDPKERHRLGAHFTPRAYVERLVRPTIEEPLRAEWDAIRDAAAGWVERGQPRKAKEVVQKFHRSLTEIRVLDPACGSGNFLYVALDMLKRLESEVIAMLAALGERQEALEVASIRVTPGQFLGIEVKPWAKEIAELVLWIGYLQWHFRMRGRVPPPEPVLQNFRNIECRDAVLAWDGEPEIVRDERTGTPTTRWDGETMKTNPVTGEDVPDESARVPIYRYTNARRAAWPAADFIVSNPPYLGEKRQREVLKDGYVEALRAAYEDLSDSVDLVAYWWHRSAELVHAGKARQAGLITTTSMLQSKNRLLMNHWAERGVRPTWAIADHVWCDGRQNAEVRVAMMVLAANPATARLVEVAYTRYVQGDAPIIGERVATKLNSDLTTSTDVGSAARRCLRAMHGLSHQGYKRGGDGFLCTPSVAAALIQADTTSVDVLRPYRNGQDIAGRARELMVIDFGLLEEDEAMAYPAAYGRVYDRVRPERATNARAGYAKYWWRFLEPRRGLRSALNGLRRYIVTLEVGKHRFFTFLDRNVAPDGTLVCVALEDAFALGVLSSRIHIRWSLAAGGWLEDKARYNKSLCFDSFPFPACDKAQKARIRELGEQLDAHRKRQQQRHPKLTLTEMYNVLEKLRSGELLSDKERGIHEKGVVAVLKKIHDDLDAAVFAAYGWPTDLSDEQILERLVALNAERAAEERNGLVRWLRTEFQATDTRVS